MRHIFSTPEVEADLVEIALYISRDNPKAADRLLDQFEDCFRRLVKFPGLGRARDELGEGLRSFPVGQYLVFYLPKPDGIELIRVLHGARDLRRIFGRA
jgi:toxin ParE1/3/4